MPGKAVTMTVERGESKAKSNTLRRVSIRLCNPDVSPKTSVSRVLLRRR